MIVEQILRAKQSKIKQYPVNSNRASELGHECLRYLVYQRTRWQEKTLHDALLQLRFDLGNVIEGMVINDLIEAGFTVTEQQRPFRWNKYDINGKVDCKILHEDRVYPCEIKSAAPNPFQSINSINDMLNHKYPYMRRYPAQLTLYLLMSEQEEGLFLFKNKSDGQYKEIWMNLDYEFAESLIQKAEAINVHMKEGLLPDPIEYEDDVCGECAYNHICCPDRIGQEVEVLPDTDELAYLLDRYNELRPWAKDFDKVDERINEIVKGRDKLLAGKWYVEGKWLTRTSYPLPDELKEQYATTTQYWKKKIIPVG